MKQQTVNEFNDGLNLDLHPLVTPKTVLTDNLNGTFITYNGNEFCLQNDRGNKFVVNLTEGYIPNPHFHQSFHYFSELVIFFN